MSLDRQMQRRREQDAELERYLGIRQNDPVRTTYGGKRYSRQDLERIEEDRIPWLKRLRRRG